MEVPCARTWRASNHLEAVEFPPLRGPPSIIRQWRAIRTTARHRFYLAIQSIVYFCTARCWLAVEGVHAPAACPGGPGCQFTLFDQQHVGPTDLGHIKRCLPYDPTADEPPARAELSLSTPPNIRSLQPAHWRHHAHACALSNSHSAVTSRARGVQNQQSAGDGATPHRRLAMNCSPTALPVLRRSLQSRVRSVPKFAASPRSCQLKELPARRKNHGGADACQGRFPICARVHCTGGRGACMTSHLFAHSHRHPLTVDTTTTESWQT